MKFYSTIISIFMLAALFMTGLVGCKGANTQIEGLIGPNVSVANGIMTTSMVFKNLSVDIGASIPIQKYPNSSFEIAPDFQSGGTLLTLRLSVPDFLGNQGEGLDPQALPGGRPLPGVADGALPAVAVSIPALRQSVLYVGPNVIGLFVPLKMDLAGAVISSRFYNSAGDRVGNLSLIGQDNHGENSGVLLLMDPSLLGFSGEAARIERLQYYFKHNYR